MSGTNPDSRPLPNGWITQYDDGYKAWFYIDTKANPPTPSWTHPSGPPPANPSHSEPNPPYRQSSHSTVSSGTAGSYAAAPAEPKNPDARPLPAGWFSQYDENHKAWFYVDTHANPPTPSWVHPLGPPPTSPPPVSSQASARPNTSSPPPANPGEPQNPDKRPLPAGWVQQYDPGHKAFFYVDTTAPNPTPVWTHPLESPSVAPWPHIGSTTSPTATPAKVTSPPPQPAAPGEPENPDKRPLPPGWVQQYDLSYKAFFYVNTAAPNPTPSWAHPSGPPPASTGPQPTSGPASSVPSKATSPPPQSATPGQPENPDKRPMPTGWIQQYEPSHKAWFYVDTTLPNPSPTWVHPLGPPAGSPAPGTQSSSFGPQVPTNPGQPTNPDKRPLPTGWIDQYDTNYNLWFYVDTRALNPTPSWTHPLGPPPTSPTPTATSISAPTATPAPTGPQNPDTRPLPAGWVSEYDPARNAWFYVDTTKNPPASIWTHPLGPSPIAQNPPASGGYNPAAPMAPYGQPAYGGGAPQQHKQGKDQFGGLLGGLLGGKGGGKASKYLGGVSSGLQSLTGKYGGGNQGPPGAGSWSGSGQPQQPYGAPPQGYGGPPQGPYPTPGQY